MSKVEAKKKLLMDLIGQLVGGICFFILMLIFNSGEKYDFLTYLFFLLFSLVVGIIIPMYIEGFRFIKKRIVFTSLKDYIEEFIGAWFVGIVIFPVNFIRYVIVLLRKDSSI